LFSGKIRVFWIFRSKNTGFDQKKREEFQIFFLFFTCNSLFFSGVYELVKWLSWSRKPPLPFCHRLSLNIQAFWSPLGQSYLSKFFSRKTTWVSVFRKLKNTGENIVSKRKISKNLFLHIFWTFLEKELWTPPSLSPLHFLSLIVLIFNPTPLPYAKTFFVNKFQVEKLLDLLCFFQKYCILKLLWNWNLI
jgi:hypothetical protein